MTQEPRRLKVFIIDDELVEEKLDIVSTVHVVGFRLPASLEYLSTSDSLPGIDSWKSAIRFWWSFQNNEIPDLIVADVKFSEDRTTPLSFLFHDIPNEIPTGLSHLKDFAVLSRASGTPLGVGLRTMDPTIWRKHVHTASERRRAVGYLAAHLVGEISAILGHDLEIEEGDRKKNLHNCLSWLERESGTSFLQGLRIALANYRRSLFKLLTMPSQSNVFILPKDYLDLLSWCRQMEQSPKPVHAEHDIGLALTYNNGKRDIVSLASIFADYEDITTKPLKASAFALNPDVEEPWKNDDDSFPRIGAFLCQLGKLKTACDDAADAAKAYQVDYPLPAGYKPPTLATLKKRGHYDEFTVGLTVLFQLIRIEQRKSQTWEEAFENYSWDPIGLKFKPGILEKNCLRKALQSLVTLIKQADPSGDGISIDDFVESSPDGWVKRISVNDKGKIQWHFDRLVDADVLDHRIEKGEGDLYTLKPTWLRSNKPLPLPPMPILMPKIAGEKDPDRIKWLRESLGYRVDFNSMARAVADAFELVTLDRNAATKDSERASIRGKVGRDFINRLEVGELPSFLADLCREYATRYLNWPEDKWPKWLRRA